MMLGGSGTRRGSIREQGHPPAHVEQELQGGESLGRSGNDVPNTTARGPLQYKPSPTSTAMLGRG